MENHLTIKHVYKHIIILTIILKKIINGYLETTVLTKYRVLETTTIKKNVVGKVKFSTTYIIVVLENKKQKLLQHLKSDRLIHFILYRKEYNR